MSDQMRILHFVPKDCLPVNTGAKLRNYHFARELSTKAKVTYLSFAESSNGDQPPTSASHDSTYAPLESFCEQVITVPHENSYSMSKMVRGLVSRNPLTVLNYTTDAMAKRLKRTLDENDFDIVHVENLLLAAYLPIIRAAKSCPLVVCDWHNIDSELMERYSKHAPSRARKIYAMITARKLAAFEKQTLPLFDGHFVVSQRDRKKMLALSPASRIFVADNGVDSAFYSDESIEKAYALWLEQNCHFDESKTRSKNVLHTSVERNRILFVGSMDYHANTDAVEKFAREVWQTILEQHPQLTFTIVGRNPSPEIRALGNLPGIEITGTVDDVRPFYKEALAAVVPLRIGGGSRLKILEAMAAGVPVISTRLGAEGLEVKDRQNIWLAESGDDFCLGVSEIIKNATLQQSLSFNARSFVRERYDWSAIGKTIFNSYQLLTDDFTPLSKVSEDLSIEPDISISATALRKKSVF